VFPKRYARNTFLPWEKELLISLCQLQVPSKSQITIKTTIVPKQPPPNFQAPIPESSPLNKLFIIGIVLYDFIVHTQHSWIDM
jgi:hypothetical protein